MELLNLQDYKARVDEFYQKNNEYLLKLSLINVAETNYCDTLTDDEEDVYFETHEDGTLINDIARGYEEQRKSLKEKYKGFDNCYNVDYGTILTDESVELFKYGKTSKSILEEAKKHYGERFLGTYDGKTTVYTFRYVVITPGDFYWVGESDEGKLSYFTCVKIPNWIEK